MRTLTFQRVLGSGAFGSVYLAELAGDRGFRRPCAVKVLHSEHAGGEAFMTRVRDEARLLGLLQDDNILEVMELARVDGRDAVLMEYVEGADLDAVIGAGQRPPPRVLAEIGAVAASALHRAHRARHPGTGEPLNVVHRDVKPANVMLTARGGVKLLDFGVARARFEMRESRTGQFVLGTLNYMAPEYITTGDVSPAADVYALGLTLWEAATGEVFGQPRLRPDLHRARLEERLAALPSAHAPLADHLRHMLAWEPSERPDAGAVESSLYAAADELRGAGLRTWAAEVVPGVLTRSREGAQDTCGLLGRTVPIEAAVEGGQSLAANPGAVLPATPPMPTPAQTPAVPQSAAPAPPAPVVPLVGRDSAVPAAAGAPPPPPAVRTVVPPPGPSAPASMGPSAPPRASPSWAPYAIAIAIGGGLALIVVGAVVAFLFTRNTA